MFWFTEETEEKKLQIVEGFVSFVNLFKIEKLKSNNSRLEHNGLFFSFLPPPSSPSFWRLGFPFVIKTGSGSSSSYLHFPNAEITSKCHRIFSLICFLQNSDWYVAGSYANPGWSWGSVEGTWIAHTRPWPQSPALREQYCSGCHQPRNLT